MSEDVCVDAAVAAAVEAQNREEIPKIHNPKSALSYMEMNQLKASIQTFSPYKPATTAAAAAAAALSLRL